MNIRRIAGAGLLAALTLAASSAQAIEAPKPQPPREEAPQAPPPELNVTPTDERAFYEKIQRVTAFRAMRGLKVPAGVIADLGSGNADAAIATLNKLASGGDGDANIALVLTQHWCSAVGQQRAGDPKAVIAKLVQNQP